MIQDNLFQLWSRVLGILHKIALYDNTGHLVITHNISCDCHKINNVHVNCSFVFQAAILDINTWLAWGSQVFEYDEWQGMLNQIWGNLAKLDLFYNLVEICLMVLYNGLRFAMKFIHNLVDFYKDCVR